MSSNTYMGKQVKELKNCGNVGMDGPKDTP